MFRSFVSPDRLFDRPWQSGHPFCRRVGRIRRCAMLFVLLGLCAIIGGYGYLTDSERVRGMAQSYLSNLVGGRVEVGAATLSVFEGLRLDRVNVYVDHANAPDSLLFSAQTFVIKYDPRCMLAGKLEATQIIAQKPHVHLTENVDTRLWNWHRLVHVRPRRPRARTPRPVAPAVLPEILLRNARVEISEVRDGRLVSLGSLAIDGRLAQAAGTGRFNFDLQSRGTTEGIGPFVSGSVAPATGQVSARIMNFQFGRDIRSMLPGEVRTWWERHELAGKVDIPVLSYTPGRPNRPATFRIETQLNGVTLALPPEEWLSSKETAKLDDVRVSVAMMQQVYAAAGFPQHEAPAAAPGAGDGPDAEDWVEALEPVTDAGPGGGGGGARPALAVDRLAMMLRQFPVKLHSVDGRFVFTERGIEIKDVRGRVENNGLKISGRIDSYRPDATAAIRISSFDSENITIPAAPRYVNSLPPQVRELYEELRPQGTGRIIVDISRPTPGARPVVSGQLDILDGQFVYDKFPYPMRNATGRVLFGRDPRTGLDRVVLQRIRGRGIESGPNRDTVIMIDGRIEPLGPTSGVNIRISAADVHSEEALRRAFPPEVRDALKIFDPEGTGRYPTFRGSFVCNVVRPLGVRTPWSFDTDIVLAEAAGRLTAFPYPLKNVTGELHIRNGYADIVNCTMKRDGDAATLALNGRVAWGVGGKPAAPPPGDEHSAPVAVTAAAAVGRNPFRQGEPQRPKTELRVTARNVPVDQDLLNALPPDHRACLEKMRIAARLDIDGRVFESAAADGVPPAPREPGGSAAGPARKPVPGSATASLTPAAAVTPAPHARRLPLDYSFGITIADARLRPLGGDFEITRGAGRLIVTPRGLELVGLNGRRGDGRVTADGAIDWSAGRPRAGLTVKATNLKLEPALYAVLPPAAQRSWQEVQPRGTIDADFTFRGPLDTGGPTPPGAATKLPPADDAAAAASLGGPGAAFGAVLRPRDLSIRLRAVPYPLDRVTGTVTVGDGRVILQNIAARHGDARVSLSGSGTLGPRPVWDLAVAADRVPADDEFRRALPPSLAGMVESLKVRGTLGFDLTKLVYRSPAPGGAAADPEIDVAAIVRLDDASLDAGVPLTHVNGAVTLAATVRGGKVSELRGGVRAASMQLTGRPVKNFRAELEKPAGKDELRLRKMQGELADGELAGTVDLTFPADGPSRYAADLIVRGADVKALMMDDADGDINGRLTASLSLEGAYGDPAARRGRGDVVVSGREMYHVPLLLGLTQVTNLTLPVSSPFNEATARYSLQGQHVAFEDIRLQASNMLITGDGSLDFATKRVNLTFVTDNPGGLKVPFLHNIFQGARQELLKIHVRGTVQEPKVSAGMMGTFTTTVDEVFKGDKPAKRPARKN